MADSIEINGFTHHRHLAPKINASDALENSRAYLEKMKGRRSIRQFSTKEVPFELIQNLIKTASLAPSGANKQPWTFAVISNPDIKKRVREEAEKEEELSYNGRMSEEWLRDLAPLGTDSKKPFLEDAPYLIVVFKQVYEVDAEGKKHQNYYVNESVGIASGFLITTIHQAGLATLTHTPSPMNFLSEILKRPENERPYLLLPVGFPADEVYVPNISKKEFSEVCIHYD